MTPEQAFRAQLHEAARARDRRRWGELCGVYADWLADQGRDRDSARRRTLPLSRRAPGLLWPRVSSLGAGLSDHQADALRRALTGRVCVLAGTPGTGKTHTVGVLVSALVARHGRYAVAVCATTGKAAVRVSAALRRAGVDLPATTVHQLLEIGRNGHDGDGWGFRRNADAPLHQRFVILDEASMLDTDLAASLFVACGRHAHVLLVGDPYQLPPVGHGAPLRDLIASDRVPHAELSEIRRNAGAIVRACAAIRHGRPFETFGHYEPDDGANLVHVEAATPEAQRLELLRLLAALPPGEQLAGCQVLVATNKERRAVNTLLQETLNGSGRQVPGNTFRVGDRVVCLRNHWCPTEDRGGETYLANGEIGQVLDVEPRLTVASFPAPERVVRIPMARREADEDEGGVRDFDLAWCVTCHKAQGSEWPVVVVLIDPGFGARQLCSREWVYTALSRAARLCVTIGRRGVLEQQARRPALSRRQTFLAELLRGE